MKGRNEIRLNEATMIDALQYYFDEVMFKGAGYVKVSSIKYESSANYQAGAGMFSIFVNEPESNPAANCK